MTRVPFPSLSVPRPTLLPAFLSTVFLAVLMTVPLAVPVVAVSAVPPAPATVVLNPAVIVQTPSEESLRTRAEEYWRLLVSGDRAGASEFMRPEDRPAFLQGQQQPFSDPVVETIELSDDGTQATLGIAFDMITPVGVFPWKIRQEWTAVDGEWMAEPRETSGNPFRPLPRDPE